MLERIAFIIKTDRTGLAHEITQVVQDLTKDEQHLMEKVLKNKRPYFKTGRPMYMTNISVYSLAKPFMAEGMTRFISKYMGTTNARILDATANVGGVTLYLAKYFKHVTALEYDKATYELLKHNMTGTGVTVKHGDALKEIKQCKYDVIFFDPPWGGTNEAQELFLGGKPIRTVIKSIPKHIIIALLIPPKFNFESLGNLPYVLWTGKSNINRLLIIDRN